MMDEFIKYASLITILGSNAIVWLNALGYFYVYEHCLDGKAVGFHAVLILVNAVCLILWWVINEGKINHE